MAEKATEKQISYLSKLEKNSFETTIEELQAGCFRRRYVYEHIFNMAAELTKKEASRRIDYFVYNRDGWDYGMTTEATMALEEEARKAWLDSDEYKAILDRGEKERLERLAKEGPTKIPWLQ